MKAKGQEKPQYVDQNADDNDHMDGETGKADTKRYPQIARRTLPPMVSDKRIAKNFRRQCTSIGGALKENDQVR